MRKRLLSGSVAVVLVVTACLSGCGGKKEDADAQEPRLGQQRANGPAPDSRSPGALLDKRARRSFDRLAARLGGRVGLTVGIPGSPQSEGLGQLAEGVAWSTIKVPIALAVIQRAGGPDDQKELVERSITASENAAADQLFASLGDGDQAAAAAADKVLREAGDTETKVSTQGRDGFSPYGQTVWPLAAQHRFMSRLAAGCLGDRAGSDYVLSLMRRVLPDQRWGLGTQGAGARFKGGWGPGTDGRYLVRQMGVIDVDGRPVVVTLADVPEDGQFASGTEALSKMAVWLTHNVKPSAAKQGGC